MFEGILLAVDGSEHSMRAAKEAGELARALKSKVVRIVVAYDGIPSYIGEPYLQQAIDARLKEVNQILGKAQEAVGKIPGEIHTELIEGSAAEAIINVASTRGSTVIVMGSRGMSNIAELVLGSTSHKVVSHAPCPVLIVR
jgi:nucleotide-binding universal stress UspA family protein